ncbi:MAG: hypothetical protein WC872_03470 [Candidatus Absconditabacterales bacterium]
MIYPKYQENFMIEAIPGHCSTACFMGILNYFWYTQFNMKDTRDIIKIAKLGKYNYGDGLDEKEIAYALHKLGFDISIYTDMTEKEFNEYLKNPLKITKKTTPKKYQKYIKGNYREDGNYNPTKIDLTDVSIFQKIRKEKNIHLYFNKDIEKEIKKTQSSETLFIIGANRYTLFNEKEVAGESGGHVVLSKGIKKNVFEIYDSGPQKNPIFIKKERVIKAMKEMGPYIFVKVSPRKC